MCYYQPDLVVKNFGSAFSLPIPSEILIVLAFLICFWTIWAYYENYVSEKFSFLLLAGAVGNLIDRVRLGYVVDFIDLKVWPVFNFADIYITIAIGILLLEEIIKKNGK